MCKAMKPRFKRAAEMLNGQVKFGSINIREQYKFKNMFEIETAPTVKLWNTNTEISEIEMKSMRRTVAGITEVAEKCMLSNGIEFESCVKKQTFKTYEPVSFNSISETVAAKNTVSDLRTVGRQ